MPRRKVGHYEPICCGWVSVRDMHNKLLWHADCREGGAQEVLRQQFDRLQADGWTLEGRSFDLQFANRYGERILIGIYPTDPTKPTTSDHFKMPCPNRSS